MKSRYAALAAFVPLLLAACGGGGGDPSPANPPVTNPPPAEQPKAATGSVAATPLTCDVPAGTPGCNVSATVKTADAPNGVLVTPTGQVAVVNTTVTVPVTVPVGTYPLTVKNGATVLAEVKVTAACVPTTVLDPVSKNCVGTPVVALTSKTAATLEASAPIAVDVGITGFSVTGTAASATASCDGVAAAMKTATLPLAGGSVEFAPQSAWPSGATCTFKVVADVTNVAGTATKTIDGTFTVPKAVYKYNSFTFMVTGDIVDNKHIGYPWRIVGKVATPFTNASEFDNLALCGVYDKLHESGAPILSCATPLAGNFRRSFLVNPLTATIGKEYTGALPAGAVFIGGPWGTDMPYIQYGVGPLGYYVDVPGVGIYFWVQNGFVTEAWFTMDLFATKEVVDRGGSTNKISFMITFSNP